MKMPRCATAYCTGTIYCAMLFILLVALSQPFLGAQSSAESSAETSIRTSERLENLKNRVDEHLLDYKAANIKSRLDLLESSMNEMKWMIRTLLVAVAGEILRRLSALLNGKKSPSQIITGTE